MSDTPPNLSTGDLSLNTRTSLPDGYAFLLAAYPRPVWAEHPNNGQWCQFWLQRHQMFRDYSAALTDACERIQRACAALT